VSKTSFGIALSRIDDLIHRGQLPLAREGVYRLAQRRIPRSHAAEFAALARRANMISLSLQVLHPLVRPDGPGAAPATSRETMEYADCLAKIGAPQEARSLLVEVSPRAMPEVLLVQASAWIHEWNYAEAIPLLERFVAYQKPGEHLALVGKVNLAAAMVAEKKSIEAAMLLPQLLEETERRHHLRLHGTVLGIAAQLAFDEQNWREARRKLQASQTILRGNPAHDALVSAKWAAIQRVMKSSGDETSLKSLRRVGRQALEARHFEMVRDCDRYAAIASGDKDLWTHLFFGTPHESYRRQLLVDYWKPTPRLPPEYLWVLKGDSRRVDSFSLSTGEESRRGKRLSIKPAHQRLLAILASDFYRPMRLAAVHFRLFPDEPFHPRETPRQVYQAVLRVQKWLTGERIPLKVVERDGYFHLSAPKDYALVVPRTLAKVQTVPSRRHANAA
jgi:hypothetical protein